MVCSSRFEFPRSSIGRGGQFYFADLIRINIRKIHIGTRRLYENQR